MLADVGGVLVGCGRGVGGVEVTTRRRTTRRPTRLAALASIHWWLRAERAGGGRSVCGSKGLPVSGLTAFGTGPGAEGSVTVSEGEGEGELDGCWC